MSNIEDGVCLFCGSDVCEKVKEMCGIKQILIYCGKCNILYIYNTTKGQLDLDCNTLYNLGYI